MDDMIMGFTATIRFEIVTGSRFFPFSCLFYSSHYSRVWSDGDKINRKELSWDKVIISNSVFNI